MSFDLPGQEGDLFVIPVSGGADSAALALYLCSTYPRVPWQLVFTDTLQEPESTYEQLESIEAYTGRTIYRILPPLGLYALVAQFNGFLPSGKDRWCTRILKTEPFERWVSSLDRPAGSTIWSFVGIRADENRTGLISRMDDIQTVFPFVDLGITRSDVYAILQQTIGIPAFYRDKTRSGCTCCPFQRKTELLAQARTQPLLFLEAASKEKLEHPPEIDRPLVGQFLFPTFRELFSEFPNPPRSHRKTGSETDLFRTQPVTDWFVGAEFFVDPRVGGEGIWWQDIVTFGSSSGGVSRALAYHYQHRVNTAPVIPWEMSPEEMRKQLRLAIYHLQVPADAVPRFEHQSQDYTWHKGESFAGLFLQLQAFQRLFLQINQGDFDPVAGWRYWPKDDPLPERESTAVCFACSL